ncbi:hypothetical protein KP509_02G081000 [Ceratopteris richardii]|uniref:Uncharacterized protein n=1 Tax=Ceratopteris richardii TaxID=49495 RepID=A0A8T2VBP7_CERRI|nr:hypothetical protein KP509_02G081000 [Ceratopteris richardii]
MYRITYLRKWSVWFGCFTPYSAMQFTFVQSNSIIRMKFDGWNTGFPVARSVLSNFCCIKHQVILVTCRD